MSGKCQIRGLEMNQRLTGSELGRENLTADRSTGGRSRTSNCRLNRAPPYR
jgi:hypothetical protein